MGPRSHKASHLLGDLHHRCSLAKRSAVLPPRSPREVAVLLRSHGLYRPNTVVFPVLDNARLNPNYVDSVLEMHLGTPSPFEIPSSSSSSSSSSATLFSAAAAAGARSFSYETGDHVGVYPRNDPDLISRLAARCGFDLDDVLTTHTTPTKKSPLPGGLTEREALTYGLEVQSAPKVQAVRELAAAARDPKERRMLEQLVQQPQLYREYVWKDDRHVIGLLEEFPSIDLSFLTLAQHVLPRYSPASTQSALPASSTRRMSTLPTAGFTTRRCQAPRGRASPPATSKRSLLLRLLAPSRRPLGSCGPPASGSRVPRTPLLS